MVDAANGLLGIEWIEGVTVKYLIPRGLDEDDDETRDPTLGHSKVSIGNFVTKHHRDAKGLSIDALVTLIGTEIGKMHQADVIHGDLTTSNMMLAGSQLVTLKL